MHTSISSHALDRARGALIGLAVGDAVGTTLEFKRPGTFAPITDMVGGGPFHLPAGAWTDDTSLALCLAESLIVQGRNDAVDQATRYVRWWRNGHLSSTGTCFDIGGTTSLALRNFLDTGDPIQHDQDQYSASNGSLMRLAPVPIAFHRHERRAARESATSSQTTHALPICIDACYVYGGMIAVAINGAQKSTLTDPELYMRLGRDDLHPAILEIIGGSYRRKAPPQIKGTGFVRDALEAALWAFNSTDDYRSCILAAANLGDDADTTAAIAGQIAGAYYGYSEIPAAWREKIVMHEQILQMADDLYHLYA